MRRYKYLRYALIAIGLYIFWSSVFLPVSADHTPLCGICHAPSQAYRSAYLSAHGEIGCLACHRSPGIGGLLASDFLGLHNLGSEFTRAPAQEQHVDNDACLVCHDRIMDEVTKTKNIRMSHREVIDAAWRCDDCHGNAGHTLPGIKTGLQNPSMDKCFGCHRAPAQLRRCGACHIGRIAKGAPNNISALGSAAHTKDWKSGQHGVAPQGSCPVCHDGAFCKSCHKISVPHDQTEWPYKHGRAALNNKKACDQCHRAKFCLDCHKTPMPHPAGYDRKHMSDKQSFSPACNNCHLGYECAACHRAHKTHRVGK